MDIIEELTQLRCENQQLREQRAMLQAENVALVARVEALEMRLTELGGKPPAPPPFVKPNKPKPSGPKAPRRKRMAAQNHGRKRAMTVTRREEHRLERCPDCGARLRHERPAWTRQVIELPPPQPVEVIEHVVYEGHCQHCGKWQHPCLRKEGVSFGQRRLGPRLCALICYLRNALRLPLQTIRGYLSTLHGVQVSVGALTDVLKGLARQGQAQEEALWEELRGSAIVHADETGWREDGQNGYIWLFSTPGEQGVRCFLYDRHRGQAVVARQLGESFQGVLVSDFYGAYNWYAGRHQRCWAHLLRDLHTLKEEHGDRPEVLGWAQALRALYDRGQTLAQDVRASQQEKEQGYLELVSRAEELALPYARIEHPCRTLAKRVLRHQDELFQFVLVAGLAADNNLAERSLRPLVVARKISGGSRSSQGSQTRMTLASLFATWQVRGLDPLQQCLQLISPNSSA
jgi:transposase